ncbi:MAG TPA: glycogen synthase [Anaeromyxobacteraceae bacterium]|nr:glycogen synthase [Anaeromyxobacteraceae bacterium]
MKILFLSSELAPFAKTGGLGDVAAALPRQLRALGHDVRPFLPMYARVETPGRVFREVIPDLEFGLGPHRVRVSILESPLPGTDLPVYFVRCPSLYGGASIYGTGPDEHLRFAVLQWAALKACQIMRFAPDVAHLNDWQTALVPVLLRSLFAWDQLFARTRTLLTIHNLGHQGTFDARVLPDTGLEPSRDLLHQDELAAGRLGYLLSGILHAGAITTVSPTYAREIQTPEHGAGLDPFLRARRDVLRGILNGLDEAEWSPETDRHLAHHYSAADLAGKARNKRDLLEASGLPFRLEVPVVGVVSRLVWQKGFDLCARVLPALLRRRAFQLVVLGKGEHHHQRFFSELARAFPRQVAYDAAFSEHRAHLIEAGADLFLMPSRYEPCGLNQMYSLRYGTVPVVHRTGGLADTVVPWDPRSGRGTGFVFEHFDERGLAWALGHALDTWGSGAAADRERWMRLQRNGMGLPLGWGHRVAEYVDVYRFLAPEAS